MSAYRKIKSRLEEKIKILIIRATSVKSIIRSIVMEETASFDNAESYEPSHGEPSRRAMASHAKFNHVVVGFFVVLDLFTTQNCRYV